LCSEQQGDLTAIRNEVRRLAEEHARPAQVVGHGFVGGLSAPEIAGALALSDTTIKSDLRFARAWLKGQLGGTPA
jgi:DNA-directed RNA polymerase specialized sigma24 family protein